MVFREGDSIYNGMVRITIRKIRDRYPDDYLETVRSSDRFGDFDGCYLYREKDLLNMMKHDGFKHVQLDHFEEGTFTI